MPRSSRADAERTAARIREVAAQAFTEHGFAGVGMADIAREAGVTRGAVYHHHRDKRALFAAVVEDVQRRVAAQVEDAAGGDGWDAVHRGCVAFVHAALRPDVRRILLVDAPAVLGWQSWRESDARHSARLLEEGLRALPDLRTDPAAVTTLLSGAMNEGVLWVAEGGDLQTLIDSLEDLLTGLSR